MASPTEARQDPTSVSPFRRSLDTKDQTDSAVSELKVSVPGNVAHRNPSLESTSTQRSRAILFADGVGEPKPRSAASSKIRAGISPPPTRRFQDHVSFDTFSKDEPTEKNTVSFTLNSKHRGYKYKRRSRTFMVGIDENDYSDYALRWMLEELVDDGDEIICLRVIERDSKMSNDRSLESKIYQEEAKQLMESIKDKNDDNRAISITLEFAVGKLHQTFQHMFQIYEPAMLIVGTRGRSLGGFQGLVGRNSFSKWCLQYSPIPVVVVRPTAKREKKKKKRTNDPTRQNYAQILQESGNGYHEANTSPGDSIYETTMLPSKGPDAEAHAVAVALELPAKFDPTIKPYKPDDGFLTLRRKGSSRSDATETSTPSPVDRSPQDSLPVSPGTVVSPESGQLESPDVSEAEDSEDDEFEVTEGHLTLGGKGSDDEGDKLEDDDEDEDEDDDEEAKQKMNKLHVMEMGEAQALALGRRTEIDEDDNEGDGTADAPRDEVPSEEVPSKEVPIEEVPSEEVPGEEG